MSTLSTLAKILIGIGTTAAVAQAVAPDRTKKLRRYLGAALQGGSVIAGGLEQMGQMDPGTDPLPATVCPDCGTRRLTDKEGRPANFCAGCGRPFTGSWPSTGAGDYR